MLFAALKGGPHRGGASLRLAPALKKRSLCVIGPPLGLRGNVCCLSKVHWKVRMSGHRIRVQLREVLYIYMNEYRLLIGVFEGKSQFRSNFHVEGNVPNQPVLHGYIGFTTLSLTVFTQRNFV